MRQAFCFRQAQSNWNRTTLCATEHKREIAVTRKSCFNRNGAQDPTDRMEALSLTAIHAIVPCDFSAKL
jgi:hypothetical protein